VSIGTLRSPIALLLLVAFGLLCLAAGGPAGDGMLCLAPALALMAVLLARRYPGERLLLARVERERGRRVRAEVVRSRPARRAARMPRGGLLMGFALAVRPPPPAPSAS
jgi:hypothetical protein